MLIDFHTHVFPDALAPRAIASLAAQAGETPSTDGTVAGLCASNCTHCGKCTEVMNLVFKRDPNRAVRSSYSFPPEKPLMPGC